MNKPELLHHLRQRLATTSAEAPYCIMPRTLLLATITVLDESDPQSDPLLLAIEDAITNKERRLIRRLDQARGRTVASADLMTAAAIETPGCLWAHLSRLRAKLTANGWGDIAIIRGKGYAWHRPESQGEEQ